MSMILLFYIFCGALCVGLATFVVTSSLQAGAEEYTDRFTHKAEVTLSEMFIYMPPGWIFTLKILGAAMGALVGLVATVYLDSLLIKFIVTLVCAIPGFFIPDVIIKRMHKKRLVTFNYQMIDALQIISNSLKSGLSFQNALKLMVQEMPDPISVEFSLVLRETHMGVSMEKALDNLARRVPLQDVWIFVASVNTIYRYGGGISEICERVMQTIRDRYKVSKKVDSLTAEGNMQAVVLGITPFALAVIIHLIDPSLSKILFTTTPGIIILLIVIILDALGYYFIKRISNIEV